MSPAILGLGITSTRLFPAKKVLPGIASGGRHRSYRVLSSLTLSRRATHVPVGRLR